MQTQIRGGKLYLLIVGICVAVLLSVGVSMEASSGFQRPGYVGSTPGEHAPVNSNAPCYSWQTGCTHFATEAKDSPYLTTGQYLTGIPAH